MEALKDTVLKVMQDLNRAKEKGQDGPEAVLKKILTKKELKHIKVKYFNKGTLGLNVDSSAWLYSLNLKKAQMLQQLKQSGQPAKNIRFALGEI